ncbi:AzlD domain-containing protein [Chitinivorax sp. B]|uniref:AzlD domain-containing protein n=1 Tax=Chitinivorax sp. B TaxID=2502235 RepID=UPI0010F494D9|nr:AzlD domain-containing protein [Chitinivorax sp. B]
MNPWLAIGGMAIITFGIRYVLFAMAGSFRFPSLLERALHYVPPAVLSAIVFPAVLMPNGQTLDISWQNAYLIGAVVAIAASVWRNNLLITTVLGMSVFLGWRMF